MKKILFIITLLLLIPITTQAAEFQHPNYGFKFNYSNDWKNITKEIASNYPYLVLKKTTNYKNKLIYTNIFFTTTYIKDLPANLLAIITPQEKEVLFAELENALTDGSLDTKTTYTGIHQINGIYYVLIKYQENNAENWTVDIFHTKLGHSLFFSTNSLQNNFQDEWLEILDSYTKNL